MIWKIKISKKTWEWQSSQNVVMFNMEINRIILIWKEFCYLLRKYIRCDRAFVLIPPSKLNNLSLSTL